MGLEEPTPIVRESAARTLDKMQDRVRLMGITSAAQALISPLIGQGGATGVTGALTGSVTGAVTGAASQTGVKGALAGAEAPTADAFAALLALIPGAQLPATPAPTAKSGAALVEGEGSASTLPATGAEPATGPGVTMSIQPGMTSDTSGQPGEAVAPTPRAAASAATLGQLLSPAMRGWGVMPQAAAGVTASPGTGSPNTGSPTTGSPGNAGTLDGATSMDVLAAGLAQSDATVPLITAPGFAVGSADGADAGPVLPQLQTPTGGQGPQAAQTAAGVQRTVFSAAAAGIAVTGRAASRERTASDLATATSQTMAPADGAGAPLRPARHQLGAPQMTTAEAGQGTAAAGVQSAQGVNGSATGQVDGLVDGASTDAATVQSAPSSTAADASRPLGADAPRPAAPVTHAGEAGSRAAQSAGSDPSLAATTDTGAGADTTATTGQDSAPQQSTRPEQMLRMPAHHIPVFALNLMRRFESGARAFQLRLDPPELGKVEVKLTVGPDRSVEAVVTTERPEALAELQRAARDLAAALQEAGLDLIEGGLSFQLDQSGQDQAGGQSDGAASHGTAATASRSSAAETTADTAVQTAAVTTDTSAPRRGGAAHEIWQRARVAVSA